MAIIKNSKISQASLNRGLFLTHAICPVLVGGRSAAHHLHIRIQADGTSFLCDGATCHNRKTGI